MKGVLGVAVIQAILSAIGFVVIGVPGAGLWAGAVLVVAIGGAISQGIVGLFLGAVVLVQSYELLTAWMEYEKPATVAKEVMAGE